jgi:dienelactone hydrolase
MGTRRVGVAAVAIALSLAAGACGHEPSTQPTAPPPVTAATSPPGYVTYPVGLRVLHLRRGPHRPLTTLVFYPAARFATVGRGMPGPARGGARTPAAGRFPLVLFSHGLSGSPERYAAALCGWAAAGFVVAAPTYPFTSQYTTRFRRADIVHQPDDARYVLGYVRRLDATPGDALAGRIDVDHIAAVGHSAGGYTTAGLFTAGHDPRLRAGVIMAGWLAPGAFAGPPATMLFLQGTSDPVVPRAISHQAFDRVPWPKTYLLLRRNSHATYLRPGDVGYALMESTVIDFLRWTLDGDDAARRQLPRGATVG